VVENLGQLNEVDTDRFAVGFPHESIRTTRGNVMTDLTASALATLQRQRGTITVRQLEQAGVGTKARQRLIAARVLVAAGHSVLRIADAPVDLETRMILLCLQHPKGFITGPTGGGYLHLRRMPRVSLVHFSVPHGTRLDVPNYVRLRQSTLIEPTHVRALENGIRIASWERMAFDLAADLPHFDLLSVIEQILHERRCTTEDLLAMARSMCAPRRRGSQEFARVLLHHHGGPPTESHPELRVLSGLLQRGIPVETQIAHLQLPNGRAVRIDMAVPHVRWAVEVDIHPHHLGLVGTTLDKQRDRQLHLIDWQVERVTALDFVDLTTTLDELARLYHLRAAVLHQRSPPF
jgi:hypothetical protein